MFVGMEYETIIIEAIKYIIGGVVGTIATTYYKEFKAKKMEQRNLFIRMIAAKSYLKIPQYLINDMNIIEVIFRRDKRVLEKYRIYYTDLCLPPEQLDFIRQKSLYLDLLREIGNVVGYKNLDNRTLVSAYTPQVAVDDYNHQQEVNKEHLMYLKLSNEFFANLINMTQNNSGNQPPIQPPQNPPSPPTPPTNPIP